MENIQDFKEMWNTLNERLARVEDENRKMAREIRYGKHKTAQEKLIRKYRGFIIVEAVMIIAVTLFITNNPFVNEKYRLLTLLYWVGFFLLEVIVDFYLMMKVSNMNLHTATVTQISNYAKQCWKIHKIFIIIGLPLAIGAIILFALLMDADKFVIAGMICGGVIGVLIGLNQLREFIRCYKVLQSPEN